MKSFLRFLSLFLLVNILFDACQKEKIDPNICGTSLDPVADFAWLQSKIDAQNRHNLDTVSIAYYRYQGQDVFLENSLPISLTYGLIKRHVFNCEGASISEFWVTDNDYKKFFAEAVFQRMIWKKSKTVQSTEAVCGSTDPLKDFRFLYRSIDYINSLGNKRAAIYLYEFQGQPHFFAVSKPDEPTGRSDFAVFNCAGELLTQDTAWDQTNFMKKAQIKRLLWAK